MLGMAVTHADEIDFERMYSAFGETPSPEIRPVAERLVALSLEDIEIEADTVAQALAIIRDALRKANYPSGLSVIMRKPNAQNYRTPVKLPKATRTVGTTINLLCEQAGLVWDFSSSKLTLKPSKAEQVVVPKP